jgi:hypothetical protein
MVTQTIQFESISLSEVGSGTITAFLYDEATLVTALASIEENSTLKGRYTGTADDVAAGTYRLVVKFNDITVNDADERVDLLLAVGMYVAYRHAELDTAALALINKIEASTAGTVSGAGTDTEIFVGSNVTLTITVDADGNRSAVVVS